MEREQKRAAKSCLSTWTRMEGIVAIPPEIGHVYRNHTPLPSHKPKNTPSTPKSLPISTLSGTCLSLLMLLTLSM